MTSTGSMRKVSIPKTKERTPGKDITMPTMAGFVAVASKAGVFSTIHSTLPIGDGAEWDGESVWVGALEVAGAWAWDGVMAEAGGGMIRFGIMDGEWVWAGEWDGAAGEWVWVGVAGEIPG